MELLPDDWSAVFRLETPPLELVVRGVILYLAILVLMRILPRRTGGEAAHMDLIFMLIIADAATNSLGSYSTIGDGLVVILSVMGLNYLLNCLSFYFPPLERLVSHRPLEVVRDGKPIRANMRHEFLTDEELTSFLRQSGLDELGQVKLAVIEGKGKISIIEVEKA